MLAEYTRGVIEKLWRLSKLITYSSITMEVRSPTRLVLRGLIRFVDGSRLHFLEYLVSRGERVERIAYRFHYEDPHGNLRFRYDNAPHHPELPTHPHHKHLSDGSVVPAEEPSLPAILDEIRSLLAAELGDAEP
ncbi:hypothetical protein Pyrfu_0334 [Pyrolobus fumarii 1A]|uniref:Uncharacterized protein n=1 Tax=Pyrolobus fumarii (strain DSM 11204 / 1A) TaxID=694429 RepID=G0EFN5_PYRF1|nr:DUF6516 family protein [Pyrolobus fumarii]AEM38206.1 hypothetical protein Pyrfu_0334 [Pyrolobus fumarii 1A]